MTTDVSSGKAELAAARAEHRGLFWAVAVFSFFVNLLMLTGPLYMLNVYDRVLSLRSFETLLALSVLVAFLYAMMGILDFVRGRVMGRIGARFQAGLDRRVFGAVLKATTLNRAPREAATGLRDLEAVQRLITSPALMALFDLPWVPLFFLGTVDLDKLLGVDRKGLFEVAEHVVARCERAFDQFIVGIHHLQAPFQKAFAR